MYYKWMHYDAAQRFDQQNQYMGMFPIILSPLGGMATLLANVAMDDSQREWVLVFDGIILILMGMLSGIYKFKNPGVIAAQHRTSYKRYDALVYEMEQQLSRPPEEREDGSTYVSRMQQVIEELKGASPDIPDDIMGMFIDKVKQRMSAREGADRLHTLESDHGHSHHSHHSDHSDHSDRSEHNAHEAARRKQKVTMAEKGPAWTGGRRAISGPGYSRDTGGISRNISGMTRNTDSSNGGLPGDLQRRFEEALVEALEDSKV